MNHHWDDLQDEAIRLYHEWLGSEEPVIDVRFAHDHLQLHVPPSEVWA